MNSPHTALTSLVLFLLLVTAPLFAQTGGPAQPDFAGGGGGSGVSPFNGSFSYSIPAITVPGPHGSTISLSLSYRSGASITNGVSWVGYGWSLTPGAIVRQKQGLPDDWIGEVLQWNKQEPLYHISGSAKEGVEITSKDTKKHIKVGGLLLNSIAMYNNINGYKEGSGFSAGVKGLGGISVAQVGEESSWGLTPPFIGAYLSLGSSTTRRYKPSRALSGFSGSSKNVSSSFTLSIPSILFGYEWGPEGSLTYKTTDSPDRIWIHVFGR